MGEDFKHQDTEKNEQPEDLLADEVQRGEMTSRDIEDLRFLRDHLSQFRVNWSRATEEEILEDFFWDNASSYVVRADVGETNELRKRIVATGQLDLGNAEDSTTGVVEHIVTHPDIRGKGLGRKVMEKIIEEARKKGLSRLVLTSNPTRKAAHRLYKRLGFQIVGEQQKYDK
ncbi:MAG: GNAT family N-acetyltransferase, partial [bacterium]|nr:GNAT family N-acetyltransferase [bacterium]